MYNCIIILENIWASFGLVFEGDWAGNFILTWQHWLSGIWELRGRKARDSRLATNDHSRDVMNYLERL